MINKAYRKCLRNLSDSEDNLTRQALVDNQEPSPAFATFRELRKTLEGMIREGE